MKRILISAVWVLVMQGAIHAQNYFALLNKDLDMVSLEVEANAELNAGLGYFHSFPAKGKSIESFGLMAQVSLPLFSQQGIDFDLKIGSGLLLPVKGKFKTITGLSWNISRTADLNGNYLHTGFKLDFLPGFYTKNWVVAPHLSVNFQPWLHLRHSEYARNAFAGLYTSGNGNWHEPFDGWVRQRNLIFQTGLGVAYFMTEWNVSFIAGYQFHENRIGLTALPELGIMPFYGKLNLGYAF